MQMNKNQIFFAENGLTSTSANHIANLAKEYGTRLSSQVNNFQFYDTGIALIGTEDYHKIKTGVTDAEVAKFPEILDKVIEANSLIAWLREAIKARENLLKEVEQMGIDEYAEIKGVELPKRPERSLRLTSDDIVAKMSVKERNRYFLLQTRAAKIGKFIHPDGKFSEQRAELQKKRCAEFMVKGEGRDTLIYKYEPTCSDEVVEKVFFQLQKAHREAQAELNGILHKIDEEERSAALASDREYAIALDQYNRRMEEIQSDFQIWKECEAKRIADLRIIIPNDLKGIYETINSLGK